MFEGSGIIYKGMYPIGFALMIILTPGVFIILTCADVCRLLSGPFMRKLRNI